MATDRTSICLMPYKTCDTENHLAQSEQDKTHYIRANSTFRLESYTDTFLLCFPPVQEALWGKPRSTEANKRSAPRLLHEPLSYNTAGFLFHA